MQNSSFKLRKCKYKLILLLFILFLASLTIGFLFGIRSDEREKLKKIERENKLLRKELDGWRERGKKNCSHCQDLRNLRDFIREWDCDYCSKKIENRSELEKHLGDCREAEKVFDGI